MISGALFEKVEEREEERERRRETEEREVISAGSCHSIRRSVLVGECIDTTYEN